MNYDDFARLCLDPVRLAALGRAAGGKLTPEGLIADMDITRRTALETIATLRLAEFVDDNDRLVVDALHAVAATLPGPEPASDEITVGDWTSSERKVLRTFFSGHRLTEIPSQRSKRRIVLERLAQDFEPGVRYSEAEVSRRLEHYNVDYAALRRYLVDEDLLSRRAGEYWRTGGRISEAELVADVEVVAEIDGPRERQEPVLATRRPEVVLIPYTRIHQAELLRATDDERITRFMTDAFPYPYTVADAAWWIAKCEGEDPPLSFAIIVEGTLAGGVGCEPKSDIRTGTAEVGWWLTPERWGQGIAAIAVERYIAYCFDELGFHRLEAGVFLPNTASARVAEKAGFILEGVSRDAYLKNGALIDCLQYGLARSQMSGPDTSA